MSLRKNIATFFGVVTGLAVAALICIGVAYLSGLLAPLIPAFLIPAVTFESVTLGGFTVGGLASAIGIVAVGGAVLLGMTGVAKDFIEGLFWPFTATFKAAKTVYSKITGVFGKEPEPTVPQTPRKPSYQDKEMQAMRNKPEQKTNANQPNAQQLPEGGRFVGGAKPKRDAHAAVGESDNAAGESDNNDNDNESPPPSPRPGR